MVWAFEPQKAGEAPTHFLCAGDYTVGRKEACILVDDKSVSRKHATLTVGVLREQEVSDTHRLPVVQIISLGQFGTCRTTANGEKSLPKNTTVKLCDGDTLRFGQASVFRLRYQRISLCGPPGSLTHGVKSLASRAGIHLLEAWDESCTHVLIPKYADGDSGPAAAAALCGQLANRPLVSEEWIKAICDRGNTTQPIPDTSSFLVKFSEGSDCMRRKGLLPSFSFQLADGAKLGSYLEAAIIMAGGMVEQHNRSEPDRQQVVVLREGTEAQTDVEQATTAQLITEALVSGSTASMLQCRQDAALTTARKREREAIEAEAGSPACSDTTACDDGEDEAPPSKKARHSVSPKVKVKEERSKLEAGSGHGTLAVRNQSPGGARGDAPGSSPAAVPQKHAGVKKQPPLGDVKKEGDEGPVHYAVSKRSLTVRPYEPTFQGVIEVADSVSVVPNFKKFKKAQRRSASSAQPQSYLKSVPWTHPVTAMNTEFLREERARIESDEEAEDLFNVMVPAVRAEPMADPSDDEADDGEPGRGRGPRGGAANAKPPRPTKPAPNVEGINYESMARRGTLKSLKMPELKAFLSSRRLPVGGKKDELIERIKNCLL